MPLLAADFIQPVGDLNTDMFPLTAAERIAGTPTAAEKLTAYITAWIEDAESRTDNESAQTAWVYHRAYWTVARRMSNDPVKAEVTGQGRIEYDEKQIARFERLAAAYLSEYNTAVSAAEGAYTVVSSLR